MVVLGAATVPAQVADAPLRLDRGRFTVVAFPRDEALARSAIEHAAARDTFPGLPRPSARVLIAIAPDRERFRQWGGGGAPEWGAAFAFPDESRIVIQGSTAGSDAGDPLTVLRHELAHLALHEKMGDLPPRWFDEGYASYAAGEIQRDEGVQASLALVLRGVPPLDSLDRFFASGSVRAGAGYALSHRAVAELASLDPARGLALFFEYWRRGRSLDRAVREAYGITLVAFEQRWQSRTRRRYGGLALATDLAIVGTILSIAMAPVYLSRRRRDRARLEAMRAADRRDEASLLEAMLATPEPEPGELHQEPRRSSTDGA